MKEDKMKIAEKQRTVSTAILREFTISNLGV